MSKRVVLGILIVLALVLLVVFNYDSLFSTSDSDYPPVNGIDEENPSSDKPDGSDDGENPDTSVGEPEVNRPETKDIKTTVEGMEETNTYKLLNEKDLPFTTYYRESYEAKSLDKDIGTGVTISPKGSDLLNLDIVIFKNTVDKDEAIEFVNSELANTADVQEYTHDTYDKLEAWEIVRYAHVVHGAVEYGELSVGEHNGIYFYIYTHYAPEAADGWYPFQKTIKDEWRWKKGDVSLEGR